MARFAVVRSYPDRFMDCWGAFRPADAQSAPGSRTTLDGWRSAALQRHLAGTGYARTTRCGRHGRAAGRQSPVVEGHPGLARHGVCRFVSKDEVRHWPLLGTLAPGTGTLYCNAPRGAMPGVCCMPLPKPCTPGYGCRFSRKHHQRQLVAPALSRQSAAGTNHYRSAGPTRCAAVFRCPGPLEPVSLLHRRRLSCRVAVAHSVRPGTDSAGTLRSTANRTRTRPPAMGAHLRAEVPSMLSVHAPVDTRPGTCLACLPATTSSAKEPAHHPLQAAPAWPSTAQRNKVIRLEVSQRLPPAACICA